MSERRVVVKSDDGGANLAPNYRSRRIVDDSRINDPKQKTAQQAGRFFFINSGRGERIRTSGLYVPNVALYQAKLHPECSL